MKKRSLEILIAISSVAVFIILIVATELITSESTGFGYTAALLIFVIIMGIAGLKLAEIPDK
jgi:uncharacterized membrane protein